METPPESAGVEGHLPIYHARHAIYEACSWGKVMMEAARNSAADAISGSLAIDANRFSGSRLPSVSADTPGPNCSASSRLPAVAEC